MQSSVEISLLPHIVKVLTKQRDLAVTKCEKLENQLVTIKEELKKYQKVNII